MYYLYERIDNDISMFVRNSGHPNVIHVISLYSYLCYVMLQCHLCRKEDVSQLVNRLSDQIYSF